MIKRYSSKMNKAVIKSVFHKVDSNQAAILCSSKSKPY